MVWITDYLVFGSTAKWRDQHGAERSSHPRRHYVRDSNVTEVTHSRRRFPVTWGVCWEVRFVGSGWNEEVGLGKREINRTEW